MIHKKIKIETNNLQKLPVKAVVNVFKRCENILIVYQKNKNIYDNLSKIKE
ncbi:hypothetical protein J2S18_002403 [Eubacterium multiforme]|uniref:Uncharacterized protein n=1 Tax=Eubacterium multiforme TaxID=83339 RepID=A0ABT9UVV5_9FIRM|nr:hypothetical protein [Eubacterium multiforme]